MPYRFVHRLRTLAIPICLLTLNAPHGTGALLPADPSPPEPAVEGRALWVNRFEYNSPADITQIIAKAASANFNVIYFQVRGQGDAYYKSDLEPCAVRLCGRLGNGNPPFDPLEIAIREAHARGVELHAWLNALTGWAATRYDRNRFCALLAESRRGSPRHMLLAHPDWVMTLRDGTPMDCFTSHDVEYAYVSPGIPGVRAQLAAVAADIVRRYAVDGIHLDRIRYPGPAWSYDEPSLAAFAARFGRAPASSSDPDWQQFRREQIDATVQGVFDAITEVRASVVLSAAVWPIYDRRAFGWPSSSGIADFFQDTREWTAGGYLDVAAPMSYFPINAKYCSYRLPNGRTNPDWACLLDEWQGGLRQSGRQLYMGLWAPYGPAELARQVELGREKGVQGFALYSYESAEKAGLFDALPRSVFRSRAAVPASPRN